MSVGTIMKTVTAPSAEMFAKVKLQLLITIIIRILLMPCQLNTYC